ncbi:hypothetical protein [Micromonospora sp. DT47]|uniref:hypothetical protein n=1 Tax=Micromonospora sp. DT47 TaxID=3393431 RepID=UPI003CF6150B
MNGTITPTAQQETWYFTFGSGQQHDGRYVVIPGSYDAARDEMFRHFSNAWSFQYASAERAGVDEFGLVELPREGWPEPIEAHAVDCPTCSAPEWPAADDRPCCDFAEATGGDTHAAGCAGGAIGRAGTKQVRL